VTSTSSRRRLVGAASALAEGVWRLGFTVLGRARRQVAEWEPLGGGRVLVVAPHPDDETLGCGGTLVKHRRAGDMVRVVQVTDGRASRAGGLGAREMAARRQAEARQAMAILGVDLVWLGLPEREWREDDLLGRLRHVLAETRPALLYAPSPIDYHPEHVRVARVLAGAAVACPVRVFELGVPLGPLLPDLISDISQVEVESVRRAALAAYASQTGGIQNLRRLRRYAGAYWLGAGLVEPFWQLTPEAYQAVVAAAAARPTSFRGLRGRAFDDPLSFGVGWTARRQLARAAARAQRLAEPRPSA
jgi:LmbE family N-acetylglucosaminyl deacetylase